MKDNQKSQEEGGNASTAPPIKRRLKSAQDVRTFLADLVNKVNRNEVDPAKAKCLGYLVQILNSVINTSDLEKRLEALEELQQTKGHRR